MKNMALPLKLAFGLGLASVGLAAPDDGITWLVTYDGSGLPQQQGWVPVGSLAAGARIVDGTLKIVDDSLEEMGAFRATWKHDPSLEIVVEARLRVESVFAGRGTAYPSLEGAAAGVLVSDGRHQEGLALRPDKVGTFLDRLVRMNTRREFNIYRLIIRGNDMSVYVNGEQEIIGKGAFWKPADTSEAFIQFGSNAPKLLGESYWTSVRLGLRKPAAPPGKPKLKITLSEPWDIPPPRNVMTATQLEAAHGGGIRHTRPFLHDLGKGILLMAVAQGPDAYNEPYGVMKSTDEGRTWQPIDELQLKAFGPQGFVRLSNGDILGVSRSYLKYVREDGVFIGMSYHFDPKAERFRMFENKIIVPPGMATLCFNRDIFELPNGEILASVYGPTAEGGLNLDTAASGGSAATSTAKYSRYAFLLKSTDRGATWRHFSTLGPNPEPSVVRFSESEMMAILRTGGWQPFQQIWSHDGGKTWSSPITLEMGSVDADMVNMSNGVLACSYGRPGSNLMFSTDKGKTWDEFRVITDEKGYNYTAIREIRPGRLLYVHDAPRMQALYVDVERL